MSRRAYDIIINVLLFYFVSSILTGFLIRDNSLAVKLLLGLGFGVLMAFTPQILQFFKITVNNWSSLLLSLISGFLYFFVLRATGFAEFGATSIDFGLPGLMLQLNDFLSTLLFVSFVTAALSVLLKSINKG